MWQTYPTTTEAIQNSKLPRLPDGRKIMEKEDPKNRIKKYSGVRRPQIGQTAKMPQMKTATPARVMIGIRAGTSSSRSISRLRTQGPYRLMYIRTASKKPVQLRAMLRKKEFTSGLSHSYRKKLVL